jgi:uncharacterized membrane protein
LPKGIVINTEPSDLSATLAAPSEPAAGSEHDQISQNIEAVLEFYAREELKISHSQRFLERISEFIGGPVFMGMILLFVSFWLFLNWMFPEIGMVAIDPTP